MTDKFILNLLVGAFIGMVIANLVMIPLLERWSERRSLRRSRKANHRKETDFHAGVITRAYKDEMEKLRKDRNVN